ncbi:sensor histidine kinase [Flavobacterium sp. '19STA2R22 D10 B1']|uniref:sensor histidine kinase n=1 Tax=Flavobacterium aerium TaxID=3037261 RepID=UPI00278C1347|nr:ATP-binding protein [Flavobacterium sp. '19STA2R22 D10 B1']
MKIKTKLTLGVGLLFLMIIALSFLGEYYIRSLKNDTNNILKANHNTLEYARNMFIALDDMPDMAPALANFKENLKKQQNNISEQGEREATQHLSDHFAQLQLDISNDSLKKLIRGDLSTIMKYNMDAIQQKSDKANETAEAASVWIALTGTFCFFIAFSLLINLPNNIANPIHVLSESIKQIADKNYTQRVNFEDHNEFGELAKSFNVMAEKLQEYNNSSVSKLMFEKKRLDTLINNMHDPIIGLDHQKQIIFANDEAIKILGFENDSLVGNSIQTLALQNDLMKSLIQELCDKPIDPEQKRTPLKIFAHGKESYFDQDIINITITPTGEQKLINIGDVIILRNITQYKELDFAKTNFIATISHELKTPISSIKLSLQLLENKITGVINPEQQLLIDSVKDDSNRLLKITGELLNLSQVETGNIQLNIQKSSPYEILHFAIEAIKVSAEQKHIEITTQIEEDLPAVIADTEKTAWVLINFLTNAIRYSTEMSTIVLKINTEVDVVNFQVIDSGKGIDNQYKEKIFNKYFQVPGSNNAGTGLGLAISKEFIEAQGGIIGMDSEIGLGSTFYFKLSASRI